MSVLTEVSKHNGNTYSLKLDINCLVELRSQTFKTYEFIPLSVLGGCVEEVLDLLLSPGDLTARGL